MKIFLLFMSFTICASQKWNCPSNEDIKPCICLEGKEQKLSITCEGLSSAQELAAAVKGMNEYKIAQLHLTKSNIGTLSANTFKAVEIQDLKITFTNLTSLSESLYRPPFLGQEDSLAYLEIRDSFIDENNPLTRLSLSHLNELTFLQLEGNIIPKLGNDWFESGPYALKELHLLDTRAFTLGSHAFVSLSNLRKFSFTGGAIKEISRNIFPKPALFLESLDLSNNKLSMIPDDFFSKMPSLNEVFLDNNDLTTINEISFAPVWSQLSRVFFYGNPLDCDDNMKWIYKYRLPESLQGHCASPPALKFKSLTNLTSSDFD